jgi:uncharacterized damage-inducible protein DinB
MVEDLVDPRRVEPPYLLGERAMLEAWLEFHRITLLLKCEGLDDAARKARPVASSDLSLHGLVRHMAEVERNWFWRTLRCDDAAPRLWGDPVVSGNVLVPADADWDSDLQAWQAECKDSRATAAALSLDDAGVHDGRPCSLRWVYVHMIEEYSRHNGHADLLRELVDGTVGW